MDLSNAYRIIVGESLFNQVAFVFPGQMYLALYTDSVDGDGVGTEVAGGGYARVQLPAAPAFTRVANVLAPASNILFPTATAAWGSVVSFGLWNAAQDTLVAFDDLVTPLSVVLGQRVVVLGDGADPSLASLRFTLL